MSLFIASDTDTEEEELEYKTINTIQDFRQEINTCYQPLLPLDFQWRKGDSEKDADHYQEEILDLAKEGCDPDNAAFQIAIREMMCRDQEIITLKKCCENHHQHEQGWKAAWKGKIEREQREIYGKHAYSAQHLFQDKIEEIGKRLEAAEKENKILTKTIQEQEDDFTPGPIALVMNRMEVEQKEHDEAVKEIDEKLEEAEGSKEFLEAIIENYRDTIKSLTTHNTYGWNNDPLIYADNTEDEEGNLNKETWSLMVENIQDIAIQEINDGERDGEVDEYLNSCVQSLGLVALLPGADRHPNGAEDGKAIYMIDDLPDLEEELLQTREALKQARNQPWVGGGAKMGH